MIGTVTVGHNGCKKATASCGACLRAAAGNELCADLRG